MLFGRFFGIFCNFQKSNCECRLWVPNPPLTTSWPGWWDPKWPNNKISGVFCEIWLKVFIRSRLNWSSFHFLNKYFFFLKHFETSLITITMIHDVFIYIYIHTLHTYQWCQSYPAKKQLVQSTCPACGWQHDSFWQTALLGQNNMEQHLLSFSLYFLSLFFFLNYLTYLITYLYINISCMILYFICSSMIKNNYTILLFITLTYIILHILYTMYDFICFFF